MSDLLDALSNDEKQELDAYRFSGLSPDEVIDLANRRKNQFELPFDLVDFIEGKTAIRIKSANEYDDLKNICCSLGIICIEYTDDIKNELSSRGSPICVYFEPDDRVIRYESVDYVGVRGMRVVDYGHESTYGIPEDIWSRFVNGDVVINTITELSYLRLLQRCDAEGITWSSGDLATKHPEYYFDRYNSDTCVRYCNDCGMIFGDMPDYEDKIIVQIR